MDDAFRVGRIQSVGNLNGHIEQFAHRQGHPAGYSCLARYALPERPAFEQFQDQESLAFGLLQAKDGSNVLMVQRCQQARLTLQSCQSIRIVPEDIRQDLDGHLAAQDGILGAIDHPHPARTDFLQDPIMKQGRSGRIVCRLLGLILSQSFGSRLQGRRFDKALCLDRQAINDSTSCRREASSPQAFPKKASLADGSSSRTW